MKRIARRYAGWAALLTALAVALAPAHAQAPKWPEKPVRVVVPFPAGGGTDMMARTLAQRLSDDLGQQFFVENRGGAGGNIGAEFVARSAPDGYTIIFVPASYAAAANPALYRLSFDPVRGIAPIAMIASQPLFIAVNPSVKANDLKELVALARANPGGLSYGSSGSGGTLHLAMELFKQLTGTSIVHVPYKGSAPALVDLVAGRTQVMVSDLATLLPHVKSGKLRLLGVTTDSRWPTVPEVPAMREAVPGYSLLGWYGLWGPAGMPQDIIARLNQSIGKIVRQPDLQARMRSDGLEAVHVGPEEFGRVIERDIALWGKIVRDGNIKVD